MKNIDRETSGSENVVRQDGFSETEKTETGAGRVGETSYSPEYTILPFLKKELRTNPNDCGLKEIISDLEPQ